MLKKNLKITIFFLLISLGLIYYGSINKLIIFDLSIPNENSIENTFKKKIDNTINNSTTLRNSSLNSKDILERDSSIFILNNFFTSKKIISLRETYFKNLENEIKKNIILNDNKIKNTNSKFRNYSFKKIKGTIFYRLEMISRNPKELTELTNTIIQTSKEVAMKNLNTSLENDYKFYLNQKFLSRKNDLNENISLLNYCKLQYEKDPVSYKKVNELVKTDKANVTLNLNKKFNNNEILSNEKNEQSYNNMNLSSSLVLLDKCAKIDFKNFDIIEKALKDENENINKTTMDAKKIKFNETLPDLASNINIFIQKLINPIHVIIISIFSWIFILYFLKNKKKFFKDFF